MNEPVVTLQGNVGGPVSVRAVRETTVATFRLACTPRRYQRESDEWVDLDTQWFTVSAWRALGDHCAASLRVGDPVVVHGRLRATTWTNSANIEITSFEVDATVVGHDLNRGTAVFERTGSAGDPQGAAPTSPDASAEAAA